MKFSIIIIAHKRKEYILEAVFSATYQNIPRDMYEIVVVKNFKDAKIDYAIEENGARSIYTDKEGLSDKVKIGILGSKGEILCFLEDDDTFTNNKLSSILEAYNMDTSIDYIHNQQRKVLDNLRVEIRCKDQVLHQHLSEIVIKNPEKIVLKSLHFNLSSVSISRGLGNYFCELIPDGFIHIVDLSLFLAMFETNIFKFLFINQKLTDYKIHNSSHLYKGDFGDFAIFEYELSLREITELKALKKVMSNTISLKIIDCLLLQWKLRNSIFLPIRHNRKNSFGLFIEIIKCLSKGFNIISIHDLIVSFFNVISKDFAARVFFFVRFFRIAYAL